MKVQSSDRRSLISKLNYSYFQVNKPRGRGTALLCPYNRCALNT
ncbi:MAG: hypothetical protein V7K35_07250 [Nostoc sp.]